MTFKRLVLRSASYYWRTNLAVCLGVAAAVAVLGGALLVGDSVRGSLRDIAISRLGRTAYSVSSADYFREALADDVSAAAPVGAAPLIAASGFVTHEPSGRRAANVLVYGVDERFWRFHGIDPRDGVFVSPALAAELGAGAGDVLLTRLEKPSAIPLESLFAHKEDAGRTVRLSVTAPLPREQLGEFSLKPQQAEVRAVFAPLRRLQRDLAVAGRVNTLLIGDDNEAGVVQRAFQSAVTLDDLGIRIEVAADKSSAIVESAGGVVSEPLETATRDAGTAVGASPPMPVFTYLANTIRVGNREIPYSLVSGVDLRVLYGIQPRTSAPARESAPDLGTPLPGPSAIVLNDWAARDLGASVGDPLQLEFFLWDPAAGLRTAVADFTVTAIVPMTGLAADRRLAPEYPGITGAETLSDWDPPFPLDLSRVRKQDEQYWHDYRATPKAFIGYERARDLWSTRYGRLTGLRFGATASRTAESVGDALGSQLQKTVAPASLGMALVPSRRLALDASAGATNFGEYFTYFSFFIVFSALLLTVLFFRLGVEQRLRQIGILRASGYTAAHIRRMLLLESGALAVIGSLVGIAGAVGYAHVIVFGLRTWWVGAVGTSLLQVHISWLSLAIGAVGGMLAAAACVLFSMRAVARRSPRMLLGAHSLEQPAGLEPHRARRTARLASSGAVLGFSLITLAFVNHSAQVGAFFGAGAALLVSCLMFLSAWLRSRDTRLLTGRGTWAVSRLGFRGAAFRPGRSVLSAALVASAVFIIVSVGAFRRGGGELTTDSRSGTGGFVLLAQSDVPLVQNPNEPAGRDALGIQSPEFARARFTRFRMRPGDDASCLNLYRPGNPTIIAPEPSFIDSGRFAFSSSLAQNDDERANPWRLLRRTFDDGAVPVIADATSLQYVLHESVGNAMSIDVGAARPLTLRFVGALQDSVLQGQLVMGEEQFVKLFPGQQGFRYFLIDAPGVSTTPQAAALAELVERELQPFGVDAVVTTERLEAFHRVENTYLSTFQALGGLGLILGTIGLATVMFRNVLERRRELALLRAVGYNARHVTTMILAETALLVSSGLIAGAGCALIAIAPAWLGRGGTAPGMGLVFLIAGVVGTGVLSAIAATRAALGGSVLEALRAE